MVSSKELNEKEGSKNLLGVVLLKDTNRGTLGDYLGLLGINLGDGGDTYLELKHTVGLVGLLIGCTTGRTDTHIATGSCGNVAVGAGAGLTGKEGRGVTAGKLFGGNPLLLVPATEHLDEVSVGLVVEKEVFAGCGGIGGLVLLAHGDEPVGLRVVTKGNTGGLKNLDLLASLCHLVPGGGNLDVVLLVAGLCIESCPLVELGLVVVKNLGGLGNGKGVHLAVAEYATLCIIAGDKVSKLLCGVTVNGIVDKNVEGLNCACYVVKSNVVGIAVCDVGLVTNRDLGLDLVANAVVVTVGAMLYGNVGVKLLEILDCSVKDCLKLCAHLVIEGDGDGLGGKAALGHYEIGSSLLSFTAGKHENADREDESHQQNGCDDSFHGNFLSIKNI